MENIEQTTPNITITKITPDGDLIDLITLDNTDTIPPHYYNLGYRLADETQPPEPELAIEDYQNMTIYIPTRQYNPDTDTNIITYKKVFDTCSAQTQINYLTQQLASTDYIITKYAEAAIITNNDTTLNTSTFTDTNPPTTSDLNLDKYNLTDILQQRSNLRNQIRCLQDKLSKSII